MKNRLRLLLLLGALAGALFLGREPILEAAGHVGLRNVTQPLRTAQQEFILYVIDVTGDDANDTTPGTDSVSASLTVNVSITSSIATPGTDIKQPPYPCVLQAQLKDASNDDTLACTSVQVIGRNQFGAEVTQDFASVAETAEVGTYAFEYISSIVYAGCTGGGTGDELRIACTHEVGLPYPISTNGVIEVCLHDVGTALRCIDPASELTYAEGDDIDTRYFTIDFDAVATALSVTLADGDRGLVRVRYPNGR